MRVINIVKLIRATISVFFVPCCSVLLLFYLVLSYMFELNKWRWRWNARDVIIGLINLINSQF